MNRTLKARLRPFIRLHWWRKIHNLSGQKASFTQRVSYVLWDPELDSFSYDIANADEIAEALCPILEEPFDVIRAYIRELETDPVLAREVRTATRWHPQSKRQPRLGRHAVTYACLRARRPQVAVEVGVRHGLGTLVMLWALRMNGYDGSAGRLVSVDIDPYAGPLVDHSRGDWDFLVGPGSEILGGALQGAKVGFILADSIPDPADTSMEIGAALANADLPLIVVQNGWNNVTRDLAASIDGPFAEIRDQPRDHWFKGKTAHVARLDSVP